ncbi:pyridoxamine 5'-phosphate oxidase [Denitratimonas tolerans]|uniref:Pyridoxine/pyridoxamine 5'-phosphate oxidase n=1 Tax=Denitratimonas tolerans TaxID=1338420 RepID=A0AAW9R3G5_9GAMM
MAAVLPDEVLDTFGRLLEGARAAGDPEPTAMTLATKDPDGRLSARTVLLKAFDARGFVFYTNTLSRKGRALAAHPHAALLFHWKTLRDGVQVRIEGAVEPVEAAEADAYFASRPRESQIGAWASLQSEPLADRETFQARYAEVEARHAGQAVPRPPHWSGYRVVPEAVEFWYGARFRLHDRHAYRRVDGIWTRGLLYP